MDLLEGLFLYEYHLRSSFNIVQSSKEGEGSITFTSSSGRLYPVLLLEHPVARMVVKLTDAQKNYGDGGLYIVALACR